jgi:hypothetical protein
MLHERRHSGNLCVLKTYLLNSAGFSFAFAGRGDLLTGTFKSERWGAVNASGETNLAAHRCSNFL